MWCRRAEALARADEAIFCLGEHQLNPDDEESRQITVDWLNFGDPRRELEFCEAEHLPEIDLRRHIRRCCEAIARQLVAEPTKKPAPLIISASETWAMAAKPSSPLEGFSPATIAVTVAGLCANALR